MSLQSSLIVVHQARSHCMQPEMVQKGWIFFFLKQTIHKTKNHTKQEHAVKNAIIPVQFEFDIKVYLIIVYSLS